ncbi:nose resistant to fluoxetine protein 6-like isoform X2 [Haemaphysalis longicornis]
MTGGATSFLSAVLPVLVVLACFGSLHAASDSAENVVAAEFEQYKEQLGKLMDEVFAKIPPSFMRKLQAAEISTDCSIAMIKTIRAIRNLEPWELRLIDASGKYPTGLLDGSKVDLGSFDECLDTAVHDEFGRTSMGQYCSIMVYNRNGSALVDKLEPILEALHPGAREYREYSSLGGLPLIRLGICVLDDCTQNDLQALIDAVKPSIVDIEVANCVTRVPEPWTAAQKFILLFLATLAVVITGCTIIDLILTWKAPSRKKDGILCKFLAFFSVTYNTRGLLEMPAPNSTEHTYVFLHGLRYLSMCSIVFGHCIATLSDTWARHVNLILMSQKWTMSLIDSSFNSVDTFFFLRTLIPAFFVIMCMYLLPLFVDGPDLGTFMQSFFNEISQQWWHLLAQVRNFYPLNHKAYMGHYWYLSADFQAFLLSFPVYLLFRKRKSWAIATFSVMSLVACGIAAWQITGTDVPPFVIVPARTLRIFIQETDEYYILPFYHLVCYFSGCIVFFLSEGFNKLNPSKALQAAGWCVAACCGLCCVFQKLAWYRHPTPTTELGKLCTAFFDRILWSLFLSLITLACGSGHGGFVGRFLSWELFIPLSRLSFGVYLIHLPFLGVVLSTTRERVYYSLFNQLTLFFALLVWSLLLSYVLFVACEAPTVKLSKLIFEGSARNRSLSGSKQGKPGTGPSEMMTEA